MEELLGQLLGKRKRDDDTFASNKVQRTSSVSNIISQWTSSMEESKMSIVKTESPSLQQVLNQAMGKASNECISVKREQQFESCHHQQFNLNFTSDQSMHRAEASNLLLQRLPTTTMVPRPFVSTSTPLPPLPRATEDQCNGIETGIVEVIAQRFVNLNAIHSWFINTESSQLSTMMQQATAEHEVMRSAIAAEQTRIQTIFSALCLPPDALRKYEKVKLELHNLSEKLKLYEDEVKVYVGEKPLADFIPARLVIAEKRNNALYTQRKPFKDRVVLRLEKLPHWTVGATTNCTASLETPCVPVASKDETTVEVAALKNNEAKWDNGEALFNAIHFGNGFKRQPNRFRFTTTVEWTVNGKSFQQSITLNDPDQFVVTSNTNQWGESEGNLLQNILGTNTISMVAFLNLIHSRFLIQTHKKQTDSGSMRTLAFSDLEWIRNWFHKHSSEHCIPSPAITNQWQANTNGFAKFWEWYGQFVYRIRFHKYYRIMWHLGWIVGLLSRTQVEDLLRNALPDTCVLRFSDSHPGRFSVSYTRPNEPNVVRHVCVVEQFEKSSKTFNIAAYAANLPRRYLLVSKNSGFDTTYLRKLKADEVAPIVKQVNVAPTVIEGYETEVHP
uniref:Signal transducer and activator of transcription n=1 Tax=Clandestinovirus TaxID=2831644 RepID=A0A8F8PQN5_9VIRU|nr:signal transducer and activator of transcription [Clandestinovirus]